MGFIIFLIIAVTLGSTLVVGPFRRFIFGYKYVNFTNQRFIFERVWKNDKILELNESNIVDIKGFTNNDSLDHYKLTSTLGEFVTSGLLDQSEIEAFAKKNKITMTVHELIKGGIRTVNEKDN